MEDKGQTIKASIIIPVRNNVAFTKQCLNSLAHNTLLDKDEYEVIIVNNASTDETDEYLSSLKLPINGSVIKNNDNKSYSVANNQGRKLARGEFLVLLNNDTILTKGWLTELIKVFEEDDKVGVVGSRMIFPGSGEIQHAGVYFMHHGIPDHLFIRYDKEDSKVMQRSSVPAVTGACLATRTKIWDQIQGLDERYKFGYEDTAYCNTVRELGYKVIYQPDSLVYHYGSMTPGRYDFENTNFNIYLRDWISNGKYLNIT